MQNRHRHVARVSRLAVGAAVLVAASGCTLKDQEPPPLTGPSQFATAIQMSATPDVVTQDGASQSVVQLVVTNADGQPIPNLSIRMEIAVNGVTTEFGRLSEQTLATDSGGRASVVYTAPPPPPDFNDPDPVVQIVATPIGQDYGNSFSRFVQIRLVRPGTIYVPGSPIANFSYSPSSPLVGQLVQFDGSFSEDPDGRVVEWQWAWDDGEVEFGETQDHDFRAVGDYNVTLTVTDNSGKTASLTRTISVR
jgi:hypothetical protein